MPLKIQLLPTSSGDRSQLQPLTTFLINDSIAIDAGSLGLSLVGAELARVRHVIITHTHADHVTGLPIAMAAGYAHFRKTVRVYGTELTLRGVREHLFNGVIWPDFSLFPLRNSKAKSMEFVPIEERKAFKLEGLRFTAVPVNHEVPTVGVIVESGDATVVFTSDTSCTEELWEAANQRRNLRAVFIDCSFPSEFRQLALDSGHLTPALVVEEIGKLKSRVKTYCVHIKPECREKVLEEIKPLRSRGIEAMRIGKTYEFGGK